MESKNNKQKLEGLKELSNRVDNSLYSSVTAEGKSKSPEEVLKISQEKLKSNAKQIEKALASAKTTIKDNTNNINPLNSLNANSNPKGPKMLNLKQNVEVLNLNAVNGSSVKLETKGKSDTGLSLKNPKQMKKEGFTK